MRAVRNFFDLCSQRIPVRQLHGPASVSWEAFSDFLLVFNVRLVRFLWSGANHYISVHSWGLNLVSLLVRHDKKTLKVWWFLYSLNLVVMFAVAIEQVRVSLHAGLAVFERSLFSWHQARYFGFPSYPVLTYLTVYITLGMAVCEIQHPVMNLLVNVTKVQIVTASTS